MQEFSRIERDDARPPGVSRVALLSVHTCPLDQPGTGDSGGMNVYVRSVARRLAEMGVAVDVFTRWSGRSDRVREMDPGVRVIHLEAGPGEPVPKEELESHLCAYLYSLLRFASGEAERAGVPASETPTGTSRGRETFFDGKVFDPESPAAYLASLSIKKLAGA